MTQMFDTFVFVYAQELASLSALQLKFCWLYCWAPDSAARLAVRLAAIIPMVSYGHINCQTWSNMVNRYNLYICVYVYTYIYIYVNIYTYIFIYTFYFKHIFLAK